MNKRKFTWDAWNYDTDGESFIIAKSECPDREQVADYIIREDDIHSECKPDIDADIREGWCCWQIRRDWEDCDGDAVCGYIVVDGAKRPERGRGWFPVWIVRKGEWY